MFSFQIKIFLERVVLEIFILLFLLEKERKKISLSKPGNIKKNKPFQAGSYKRKEKKCRKGEFGKIIMRRIQSYEEKRFFSGAFNPASHIYICIIKLFIYLFIYLFII